MARVFRDLIGAPIMLISLSNHKAKLNRLLAVVTSLYVIWGPTTLFSQGTAEQVSGYEITFPSMGTLVSLQSFSADSKVVEDAFEKTRSEIDRLVKIFSDYDEDSEARKLTLDEKINAWQMVSTEMWEVLNASDDWNRLSDGAFDPSIGQLSILWRKARKAKRIPDPKEIEEALKYCGWKHVELDPKSKSVRIKLKKLRLDFGAIAKGYIIEKAYHHLVADGLPSSLVRAGGDVRCGDPPPGRKGWKIEIANIDDSRSEPTRFLISNAAISSSGDLHQFIEIDGKRRSHVLDPKSGIGVLGPMMVTVVATNSMDADAADTTICVLGHVSGIELAKKRTDLIVRIVSRNSSEQPAQQKVSQIGFDTLVPVQ